MATIFISLGTNIERDYYLHQGLNALKLHFGQLTLSSLFESEAVGFSGSPFYNMVIGINTVLSVEDVAETLRDIEYANGRSFDAEKFSPRTLDLDILLYDDLILSSPVQIPRNEIESNAFVLWPLAEIAGNYLHPISKKSYEVLWQQYNKNKQQLNKVPFLWQPESK